jgi:hypothetical protein
MHLYCCSVLAALGVNVVGGMGTRVMLQEKGPPLSKNRVTGPERSEVLFRAEPAALQMASWWLKTAKTALGCAARAPVRVNISPFSLGGGLQMLYYSVYLCGNKDVITLHFECHSSAKSSQSSSSCSSSSGPSASSRG